MPRGDGYLLTRKSRAYQQYDPSRSQLPQAYICQDEVFDARVLDDHIFVAMSGEQYQRALNRTLPTDGRYPGLSGYFTDQATVDTVVTGNGTFDAVALGDKLQLNPYEDPVSGDYFYNDHLVCLTIDREALQANYHTTDFRAAMGKCLANDHLGQGGGNQGFNDLLNEMVNNGTLKVDTSRSLVCHDSRCPEDRLARIQNNTLMRDADCRAQYQETHSVEEPRPEICRQTTFGAPAQPVEAPPFGNENWYNESRTPLQEMGSYLGAHNYSQMDYPTYSQDPTWQALNNEILRSEGREPLAAAAAVAVPTTGRPALEQMSAYMNAHNYGRMDYPTYSQDPEWQRLNAALQAEDGRQPTAEPVQTGTAAGAGENHNRGGLPENTVTVDARSVDLSGAMGMDSENFWNHHGNTKADYQELASHLPEVQKGLAEGRTLAEMRQDPNLQNTVAAYYDPAKMVKVEAREDGGYNFLDDGRHRVLAAQEQGCSIPVQVVNGPQQDKTAGLETAPTGAQNAGVTEPQNQPTGQINTQDAGITEPQNQLTGQTNTQDAGITEPQNQPTGQTNTQDAGITEPKGAQNAPTVGTGAGETEKTGVQTGRLASSPKPRAPKRPCPRRTPPLRSPRWRATAMRPPKTPASRNPRASPRGRPIPRTRASRNPRTSPQNRPAPGTPASPNLRASPRGRPTPRTPASRSLRAGPRARPTPGTPASPSPRASPPGRPTPGTPESPNPSPGHSRRAAPRTTASGIPNPARTPPPMPRTTASGAIRIRAAAGIPAAVTTAGTAASSADPSGGNHHGIDETHRSF